MHVLDKLLASTGNLRKAADALVLQLADLDRRLTKIEDEDARWRSFLEAAVLAPIVAHLFEAPRTLQ
jgi:hypothetical protein